MTAKEQAKEIYDSMKGFRVTNNHRKKCAIAAVDLVIKTLEETGEMFKIFDLAEWHKEVRKELESMNKK